MDAATGEHKRTLSHDGIVLSVAFSPDGNIIASARGQEVQLWDTVTGTYQRTLTGHTKSIKSVAFSPDGNTIATGSYDKTVRLWYAVAGEHLRTFTGHKDSVNSVAFSPDSNTIASGSNDKTVRLWDAVTGEEKRALTGHTSSVNSIVFHPDGRILASGSRDGTVLLWELTSSTTTKPTVSIGPSPVSSPTAGKQLTLSLNISAGENVAGYQATIQFDSTALRYVESANGDYLPPGAFFVPPVLKGNRVTLAATTLTGVSNGDGTLATLTLKLLLSRHPT